MIEMECVPVFEEVDIVGWGRWERAVYRILWFSGFNDFNTISNDQIIQKVSNKKGAKQTHSFSSSHTYSGLHINAEVPMKSHYRKRILKNLALHVLTAYAR